LREQAHAAEKVRQAADERSKEAERKLAPLSVFISRKAQRLYVRQAREPLFDAPVTIASPDVPLGTYVFSALAYTNEETDLRWIVLSLYDGTPAPAPAPLKGQRRGHTEAETVITDVMGAKSALDRIVIPKDALERIQEVVSPGSSLIISDEEMSRETGSGTDFIVVLSTEPQGGITIRRRREPEVFSRDRFDRPFGGGAYTWGRTYW
jgi:hypothetical protein